MIKVVRELPPRDSCRILVSFESRYGTWLDFPSVNELMTIPKADSDLLIFFASSNV